MYFFLYLWTDKSRKWSLRLQRGGTQEKGRPSPPTSHDNKPIPTPQKVKTAMQTPPMWRSYSGGVEKEKEEKKKQEKQNINMKVPHSPLHSEMTGIKVCRHKYYFAHHLNPLPLPSTNQQVQ